MKALVSEEVSEGNSHRSTVIVHKFKGKDFTYQHKAEKYRSGTDFAVTQNE